jgi:hypothetical protein
VSRISLVSSLVLLLPLAASPAPGVVVAPGPEYGASWFSRILLGDQWREVWTTPVEAPILDLSTFDGGLTPVQRGGGLQTKNLRLESKTGNVWVFRSIDKDPKRMLSPESANSVIGDIIQDLTSTAHPFAPLVVAPLLEAAGVIHATPRLVVMPDASQLREFSDFAGVLGFVEERIEHELPGSDKHLGTYELFERLETRTDERIDAEAFLRARLVDLLIGDWDRHVEQWRWARFRENGARVWRPAPRDRDQAFSRFDGIVPGVAAYYTKQLASFGETYPAIDKLTFSGRFTDRRFLVGLSRESWEAVTLSVRASLTDEIIAGAVRKLPQPAYEKSGAQLEQVLRKRRDRLIDASREFYRLLAARPDVRAPEGSDPIDVDCRPDGSTEVAITAGEGELFRRRFLPSETGEIRFYAAKEKPRVHLRGAASDCISLRIVEEPPPPAKANRSMPAEVQKYEPFRDWGSDLLFYPLLSYDPTRGFVGGARAELTRYGFGRDPFASRSDLTAAYSTAANRPLVEYDGEFRLPGDWRALLSLEYTGIDSLNYFGAGNETARNQALLSAGYYRVRRDQFIASPLLDVPLFGRLRGRAGVWLEHLTAAPTGGILAAGTRGAGASTLGFGEVGVSLDTREGKLVDMRGFALSAAMRYAPAIFGNDSAFTKLRAEASAATGGHLLTDVFADLRIAGEKNFGTYPYFESAFIGGTAQSAGIGGTGGSTLRGYDWNRFAGDASLVANTEVRAALGRGSFFLPWRYGLVAIGDVGRVFVDGQSSSKWHYGAGGGVWVALFASGKGFEVASSISAMVVRSDERTAFYLSSGFGL